MRLLYTKREHVGAGNNEIIKMASNHVLALRRKTSYRNSLICLYIESNAEYFTADRWAQLFSMPQYQPLYVECAVKHAMYGVRTTPQNKPQYILELERTMIDRTLVFANEFVSHTEDFTRIDEKASQKLELRDQLTHFSLNIQEPHDVVHGKFRFAFSGKTPGGTHKDDYIMGLGICFHFSRQLRSNPRFAELAHRNGWHY